METIIEHASVMPTDRDFLILMGLYENVLMSFPQISKMFFQQRSKPTIINRLTKLEKAGLIQRWRVPRLSVGSSHGVISVVFQITKAGISVLQKRHLDLELRTDPVRIHPHCVDHDLLLVDVIAAMKNKFPEKKIVHGEIYFSKPNHQGLKPDAVMILPNSRARVAIELELTTKSEKRYRDLILKYRLARDFDRVIYVTAHQQIAQKIKALLGPGKGNDRFEFLQIGDLLRTESGTENNSLVHPSDERKVVNE